MSNKNHWWRTVIVAAALGLPLALAACNDDTDETAISETSEATPTEDSKPTEEESEDPVDPMDLYDGCGGRFVELREFSTIAEQDPDDLANLADEWTEHAETTPDEGLAAAAADVAESLNHAVDNQDLYYPGTEDTLLLVDRNETYAEACDDVGQ